MTVTSSTLVGLAEEFAASQWGSTTARFDVRVPSTGEILGSVPDCGAAEARRAADEVVEVFDEWRVRTPFDRAAVMHRWHDLIAAHEEDLAHLIALEVGKPIAQARGEVRYANAFVSWNADEAVRTRGDILTSPDPDQRVLILSQPIGPAYGITPWNFPAAMVTRTVAPAIAAGCPSVLKPAEQSPLTALVLAALWQEAGGPGSVFTVLPCLDPRVASDVLLDDRRIRKLTFTGSHAVGQQLYRRAADTMMSISLELGGHAPFLVFDDADIEAAAGEAIKCKFRYSGQTCVCTNRIYVHESVADEFTRAYVQLASELRVGDPLDETTDIGPLIDQQGKDKVLRHVADARGRGATVLLGGNDREGLFFDPTVLSDISTSMSVMQEETFGPVAPIMQFATDDEALTWANATPYGLAAYYWTRDVSRVFRMAEELDAGIIGCNDGVPGGNAHVPFGGVKQSGIGRVGGRWGLEEFLETKYFSLRLPAPKSAP